jgi:tetratricopeptide (TPR) repeat protein
MNEAREIYAGQRLAKTIGYISAFIVAMFIDPGLNALAAEVNPAEAPSMSDPTVNQVFEAARTGHVDQARQMMNQVLANHPHSARAHYMAAQIDADLRNFGEARDELKTAEQIDPGLPFANAQAVAALRKQIALGGAEAAGPVRGSASNPGLVEELPVTAQADVLKRQIAEAIKTNRDQDALASLDQYHQLEKKGAQIPPLILFIEAQVAKKSGDPWRAYGALTAFLKVAHESDNHYQDAIAMYSELSANPAVKAQIAARAEAERRRQQ